MGLHAIQLFSHGSSGSLTNYGLNKPAHALSWCHMPPSHVVRQLDTHIRNLHSKGDMDFTLPAGCILLSSFPDPWVVLCPVLGGSLSYTLGWLFLF